MAADGRPGSRHRSVTQSRPSGLLALPSVPSALPSLTEPAGSVPHQRRWHQRGDALGDSGLLTAALEVEACLKCWVSAGLQGSLLSVFISAAAW